MRPSLKLEIPLGRIVGEVAFDRRGDVARPGDVALDEVGVVTIHQPHEVRSLDLQRSSQGVVQPAGLEGQFRQDLVDRGGRRVAESHRLQSVGRFDPRRSLPIFR